MIVDILVSSNIYIGRMLFVTFGTTHDKHADGNQTSELYDYKSKHNARYVEKLLANKMFKLSEATLRIVIVSRHGLWRSACAVGSGNGRESTGGDSLVNNHSRPDH